MQGMDGPNGEAVLVFDGRCGFCTRAVEWLMTRARVPVRFEPYQATDLAAYGLTHAQASRAAWWVDPDGRRHRGHRAVGRSFEACGGGWRVVGWLCRVPPASWAAALVYRFVAKYRRHLPGATPACKREHWNSRVTPSS